MSIIISTAGCPRGPLRPVAPVAVVPMLLAGLGKLKAGFRTDRMKERVNVMSVGCLSVGSCAQDG